MTKFLVDAGAGTVQELKVLYEKNDLSLFSLPCNSKNSNEKFQIRKCKWWGLSPEEVNKKIEHDTVFCNHVACWKYICEEKKASIEAIRSHDEYLIRHKCKEGHLETLMMLVKNYSLTVKNFSPDAIGNVLRSGNFEIMKLLCEYFDISKIVIEQLFQKCEDVSMQMYLIERFSLSPEFLRNHQLPLLKNAAEKCRFDFVRKLIELWDLNIVELANSKNIIIYEATAYSEFEIINFLFERYNLTVNDIPFKCFEQFMVDCSQNQKITQLVEEKLSLPNSVDKEKALKLFEVAASHGNMKMVVLFCDHFSISKQDVTVNILENVVRNRKMEMLKYLINRFDL
jgi:hypothetical protein